MAAVCATKPREHRESRVSDIRIKALAGLAGLALVDRRIWAIDKEAMQCGCGLVSGREMESGSWC